VELIAILRACWRRKFLILLGIVLAGYVGFKSAKPPVYVGVAQNRLILETARSESEEEDRADDSLTWRTPLFASLVASEPMSSQVARAAGIPADQLRIDLQKLNQPQVATPLPRTAGEAAAVAPAGYSLLVSFDTRLPIITLEARAPGNKQAGRLVDAATDALRAAADAPAQPGSGGRAFDLQRVSTKRGLQVAGGKGPLFAAAMGLLVLGLWAAVVILVDTMRRSSRRRVQAPAQPA